MTSLIRLAQESSSPSGGFDWTAVLAGVAAASGLLAIIMNSVRQNSQQKWESEQERLRREWEEDQESKRMSWEHARLVDTRWDAVKRELYVSFLGHFDDLISTQEAIGSLRQDLAEGLVNRLGPLEQEYESRPPDALKGAREEGTEQEFWKNLYEDEERAIREQLEALRPQERSAKTNLSKALGELRLVAPEPIMDLAETLGATRREYPQWGRRWERREELDRQRGELIELIRRDLKISGMLDEDRISQEPGQTPK